MPENDAEGRERVAEFIALQSPQEKLHLVCQWTLRCYQDGRMVAIRVA
jgi:hypothetical protein